MEYAHKRDDLMDTDHGDSRSLSSNVYGSPSYSPPELEECTDQKENMNKDYDKATEDDRKSREGRCKGKRKAKATSSEEDYDNGERKAARREARAYSSKHQRDSDNEERPDEFPRTTTQQPLASHLTAAETTSTAMDEYWAGHGMQFGDADAAMNESLSSPSTPSSFYNYEADNEDDPSATTAVRKPLAERRGFAKPSDLVAQQQQQQAGGGRGRGRGATGWGLEWKETVNQETVQQRGWGYHDDPHPSPVEQDLGWEVYDEAAWDRAAEKFEETEAGKGASKAPYTMRAEASNTRATDSNREMDKDPTGQDGDFVRAVTDYKALLKGTYLSYEKGDVLRVISRDCDGGLTVYLGCGETSCH